MKHTLHILAISFVLTSCASMLNSSQTSITINTNESVDLIFNEDSMGSQSVETKVSVNRSKEPLRLTLSHDSLEKTIHIKSKNSFAYWLNLYPNWHLWTGFLIDRNKPKRYTYPKRIYIHATDTVNAYYTYYPWSRKGNIELHVSLPHINAFLLRPQGESSIKSNAGFWGISLGLDYYHSKSQFINLGFSGVSDFFVPVPAAVDIEGECELMSSNYVSISNNHRYKRFTFGYGLSYARNTWDLKYYDRFDPPPPTREPVKKSHNTFGLIFPTYYQISEYFHVGVVYRPTFFRPNLDNNFEYEHLISIDFALKIPLNK